MNENQVLSTLLASYRHSANAHKAIGMSAYMRNQFVFLGISAPDRKPLIQPLFKVFKPNANSLEWLLRQLWEQEEREFHYAAIVIASHYKKYWDASFIEVFEFWITTNSWWDSVDTISSHCIGPFFERFPNVKRTVLDRWENSPNLWLNRACIIHQLQYKSKTDTAYLARVISMHSHSSEFFIQKAIGWALRQYAKTNPEWVIQFVASTELKPLSRREALKHLSIN